MQDVRLCNTASQSFQRGDRANLKTVVHPNKKATIAMSVPTVLIEHPRLEKIQCHAVQPRAVGDTHRPLLREAGST